MAEKEKLKIAIIAGASSAAKYKEQNPRASESEVVSNVAKQINSILEEIDEELK